MPGMKRLAITLVIVFAAAGGAWLAREPALLAAQELKYGTPRSLCVDGVGVAMDSGWVIERVLTEHAVTGSLYGLLPLPAEWLSGNQDASSVSLRRRAGGGVLSVDVLELPTSRPLQIDLCRRRGSCEVRQMALGAPADAVHYTNASNSSLMYYLDRPVTLRLHNLGADQLQGVRLSHCPRRR
jgi:hypothetical protein